MKKLVLFSLLLAATTLMADDVVLVENFSKVGNVSTGTYSWNGDLCDWSAYLTARRKQDTIPTAEQMQAIWMSVSNAGAAKVSTINWEGGIKAVDFKYARFGSERNPSGRVLQLKVTAGETEDQTPEYAGNAMKQGAAAASPDHEVYSHAFNCKDANAQLSIENISSYSEDLTATGICRILVGDITITPYLLYTKKSAIWNLGGEPFINEGLINNIDEGEVVYSLGENEIGAMIDAATGAVTAEQVGDVTVIASWDGLETSYILHVVPADYRLETFDDAEETAHTYATTEESTQGDVCTWYALYGGVRSMTDDNYKPFFPTKYALFRAPHYGSEEQPYIQSSTIAGGIKYLKFHCNPVASEANTTWDIRVFINGTQVGEESYGGFGAAPQEEFMEVLISDLNIEGEIVIRFENHSVIDESYTSGNKGRLAIDYIEWEGYVAPVDPEDPEEDPEEDPTDLKTVNGERVLVSGKMLRNGQLIIERNGVRYNAQGAVIL